MEEQSTVKKEIWKYTTADLSKTKQVEEELLRCLMKNVSNMVLFPFVIFKY